MKIYTLLLGPMLNCTYVVENNGQAVLIDPSWDMPAIYKFLESKSLKPAAVFFTHAHRDHMTDAENLLEKYNLTGLLEEQDEPFCYLPKKLLSLYKAPKVFDFIGLKFEVFATPGHTRGSVCIKVGNILFTGDTLFRGSYGRVDLPGGDFKAIKNSLKNVLFKLPPETKVYPGHGDFSNIEYENKFNEINMS